MGKKEYLAIARAINASRAERGSVCLKCLVHHLIVVFEADNPRFDVGRFERAVFGREE